MNPGLITARRKQNRTLADIFNFFIAGQHLCLEFAKLGCIIVGWDISKSGLQETKRKMKEIGLVENWHSYVCDVSNRHRVYETADKVNLHYFKSRP